MINLKKFVRFKELLKIEQKHGIFYRNSDDLYEANTFKKYTQNTRNIISCTSLFYRFYMTYTYIYIYIYCINFIVIRRSKSIK